MGYKGIKVPGMGLKGDGSTRGWGTGGWGYGVVLGAPGSDDFTASLRTNFHPGRENKRAGAVESYRGGDSGGVVTSSG